MNVLVTGGLGFIGSHLIKRILNTTNYNVLNIDKVSNVSLPKSLKDYNKFKKYQFIKCDLYNKEKLNKIINIFKPDYVLHLAAETHVDNSIIYPDWFIRSNIIGTYNLLCSCDNYLKKFNNINFKFIHISTDEVFGSLKKNEKSFTENSIYKPNSPYSATKASSDHLVRSWNKTFKFPSIITNCSNNYGPWQFPEKFIPKIILNAIQGKKIPIFGKGRNIRDWIHVDDCVSAIMLVLQNGKIGTRYNIGVNNEISNIDLVKKICKLLDNYFQLKNYHFKLINFVEDRKGHDFRYSINSYKIKKELKFKKKILFETGLKKTINWYIENSKWLISKIK